MPTKTFSQILESDRLLIWNACDDPMIQPRLEPYTYTAEKLGEGKTLWTATDVQNKLQVSEQNEKKIATDQFQNARITAGENLKRIKKTARLAFDGNTAAWEMLNLKTLSIRRFEEWLKDAEMFYDNLTGNRDWVAVMQNYKYPQETIDAGKQEVQDLKALQEQQTRETGEAQQATLDKQTLFEQLEAFCHHLREVAKLEFENEPQLLEKLGIFVRS